MQEYASGTLTRRLEGSEASVPRNSPRNLSVGARTAGRRVTKNRPERVFKFNPSPFRNPMRNRNRRISLSVRLAQRRAFYLSCWLVVISVLTVCLAVHRYTTPIYP